jgi:hypothetical protein
MKAMQFEKVGQPLQLVEREAPALQHCSPDFAVGQSLWHLSH